MTETRSSPVDAAWLRQLQRRSDSRGLLRLLAHFSYLAATGTLYGFALHRDAYAALTVLVVAYGFGFVTFFATMHETIHRTAFASRWLNDAVAWLSGLLAFYSATFYRYYHGYHHRFTQIPGKDPELEDKKPTSIGVYVLELSGVPWWIGKFRTFAKLVRGDTAGYPYLSEETGPLVVRSVRLQLAAYAAAIALSFALGSPLFFTYWLLPVAAAQPLLRAILLAEHGGCSEDDDPFTNTRTTHTVFLVRLLMWEMPFHAEHHRWPSIPFHALSRAHVRLGPNLAHVAKHGYVGFHLEYLRNITKAGAFTQGGSTR